MRKYATELVGTFFLVFTICCSVLAGAVLAPLAIGVVLAAMVFAGGHISGAHYNPAVTVAVFLRGRLPGREVLPYWAAQVAGALAAAVTARWVVGHGPAAVFTVSGHRLAAALVAELLVTSPLVPVYGPDWVMPLPTAVPVSHPVNLYRPLVEDTHSSPGLFGLAAISAWSPGKACRWAWPPSSRRGGLC